MAKKTQKKRAKRTLASTSRVAQGKLSRKIQIVRREDPSLTASQAAGKAAGILKQRKQKGK